MSNKKIAIKVYHGFGHAHDIVLYGHAFRKKARSFDQFSNNPITNLLRLLRLFFVKPVPGVDIEVEWQEQRIKGHTEDDGFFRAEWTSATDIDAGWHGVRVTGSRADGGLQGEGVGKIFVPHLTQYAFISDIDDTVMISHSATVLNRMKELLFKNPHSRQVFPKVAEHYQLLAKAHTKPGEPNPFFYVSSSEWNLYDYLGSVFAHNKLPDGAYLLNQVKRWYELWKTGKTKHSGKLLRILRVFEVFPNQRFVLMGDSSQSDPAIYSTLAEKYADRIFAVYIRNVRSEREVVTQGFLDAMERQNIHTCFFKHSDEAIAHSRKIGLIV